MTEIKFQVGFALPCAEHPNGRITAKQIHGGKETEFSYSGFNTAIVDDVVSELLAAAEGYSCAADCFSGKAPLTETPVTHAA